MKLNVKHSVYKIARVAKVVQGKHLYSAQTMLNNIHKKAANLLQVLINNARANGVAQGLNEDRMFIKSIVCGKAIGQKKIEIKGRGKMGVIMAPKVSIKVTLEEKHP